MEITSKTNGRGARKGQIVHQHLNSKALKSIIRRLMPNFFLSCNGKWKAINDSVEPELQLLSALRKNGCFIDIGANVGTWSKRAARIFRLVYAFEPDDRLAAQMRKSMPSNVHIHTVALSDRIGTGRFAIPVFDGEELTTRASLETGANPGFAEVFRDVRLTTLDSLRLKDIAAIKIDVEGHEGAVLDGASETIVRERPVVIVEIEERHHPGQSYSIFDRLKRHGYICCFIRDQELNLFEIEKMHELQPAGFIPPIGEKPAGYVNNFIFLPFEQRDISSAIAKELGIVDRTRVDRTR